MPAPESPRPTLMQALALFIPGAVIMVLSANRAVASFASVETDLSMLPILALCVGAILFAVGGMMTLVVMVRPFFGKRPQD